MDEPSIRGADVTELLQDATIEWAVSSSPIDYPAALAAMEARVAQIAHGQAGELVWLLEHPAIYTAGTSAEAGDLLTQDRFPVYRTGRGGQFTYHGPGQRVVYTMLDVRRRTGDIRAFVRLLETIVIDTLGHFGVVGEPRADRVGVWVVRSDQSRPREDKIAAIGIRVRRWISFHGFAINVAPDLEHFSGIVPCGIREHGVTSLHDLGMAATFDDVDKALARAFERHLGARAPVDAPV